MRRRCVLYYRDVTMRRRKRKLTFPHRPLKSSALDERVERLKGLWEILEICVQGSFVSWECEPRVVRRTVRLFVTASKPRPLKRGLQDRSSNREFARYAR